MTENLSLIDAKKLIERSKGKLKMVVQKDERATLLNIPDMDDSIPSANSDRDGEMILVKNVHLKKNLRLDLRSDISFRLYIFHLHRLFCPFYFPFSCRIFVFF